MAELLGDHLEQVVDVGKNSPGPVVHGCGTALVLTPEFQVQLVPALVQILLHELLVEAHDRGEAVVVLQEQGGDALHREQLDGEGGHGDVSLLVVLNKVLKQSPLERKTKLVEVRNMAVISLRCARSYTMKVCRIVAKKKKYDKIVQFLYVTHDATQS